MGEDACAQAFIAAFGLRAFRRIVTPNEAINYYEFFALHRTNAGFAAAIERTVRAMLQAPPFLYRLEIGTAQPSGGARLTDFELATRMSYFLWGSAPDDRLLDSAKVGRLAISDGVEAEARRLLADPRGREGLWEFFRQWLALDDGLHVTKDQKRFPQVTPALRADLAAETRRFVEDVIFDGNGTLQSLLMSRQAFLNADLARLYGVAAPAMPWQRVELDRGERAGLLTRAAFLFGNSGDTWGSPTLRGKFVFEGLFCLSVPPPPFGIDTRLSTNPSISNRERYEKHLMSPACQACHSLMDGLGFAFEHYDAIGGHRTTDGGKPIDASGESTYPPARFRDAIEMSALLAADRAAGQCWIVQWLQFALGRTLLPVEDCSLALLADRLASPCADLKDSLVSLVSASEFRVLGRDADLAPGPRPFSARLKTPERVRASILAFLVDEYASWLPALPRLQDNFRNHLDLLRDLEQAAAP